MSESQSSLENELRQEDEEYRYAYAEDFLNTSVATQIRVIREQRGLTQEELAQKIGTKQAGVSRLENVNYSAWKTETLRKIARALKVRLKITFETFGSLIDEADVFSRQNLERPSFEDDPRFQEGVAASAQIQATIALASDSIQTISLILVTNTNDSLTIDMKLPTRVNRTTGENLSVGINQNTFNPNVKSVSFGDTLSASVQLVGINREREGRGIRRYVGELAGTTEAA